MVEALQRSYKLVLNFLETARLMGGNIDIAYQKMNALARRKKVLV